MKSLYKNLLSLIILCVFAITGCIKEDENIDFVPNHLNHKFKKFDANIILNVFILAGMACFAYYNFFQIKASIKSGMVSPVLQIPMWMMYCSTIVCAISSVLFCSKNIAVKVQRCRKGGDE